MINILFYVGWIILHGSAFCLFSFSSQIYNTLPGELVHGIIIRPPQKEAGSRSSGRIKEPRHVERTI